MSSPVTRKVQYQPEQFLLAVMLLPPACLGETSVTAGSASESLFDDDEYYAWLYGGEEDEITGEELALANLLILWDYNRRSSSGSVTEPWNSSARLRKKYGRQTRPWKVTVPETAILIFLTASARKKPCLLPLGFRNQQAPFVSADRPGCKRFSLLHRII